MNDPHLPEDPRITCLYDTLSAFANLVRDQALPVLAEHDPIVGEAVDQALAMADAAIRDCGPPKTPTRSAEIIPFPGV
jgi:hypothetical protein